ncbi:MAG: SMP-30/gluconolactonase/LRE family protein [Terriglobales bacterium]
MSLILLALVWVAPTTLFAGKNKQAAAPAAPAEPATVSVDFSNVVFPPPPAVPRLRYLDFYSAQKPETPKAEVKQQKKSGWMDRLAGVTPGSDRPNAPKPRYQLVAPYGLAVDSKGFLYVADTKVGAVFIFNPENNDLEMIRHGADARFRGIFGLAMDDGDTLLVVDGGLHHVLVFDSKHKLRASFGDGDLKDPCGVAIDRENRIVYVADTELDQVLVYDADSYKLLRKIGTAGKNHTLQDPGDFSRPTNVAVDQDGNLFVTDTMNDRVEVFDADGNFIRAFGKNGDGSGDFARPKGIAIDSDGHVWVADAMLNRIQVFTPEGQILMGFGGFGIMPGQFEALTGLTFDQKTNRLFSAEQLLGRVQMFRYISNDEAKAELQRRDAELKKNAEERQAGKFSRSAITAPVASTAPAAAAPLPEASPSAKQEGKISQPEGAQAPPAPPK